MFWSGNKLKDNISILLPESQSEHNIDCASIALTIGGEVYVTPSSEDDVGVKKVLSDEAPQFIIPKGQFALLITEEIVHVPDDAIAFISFKAKYKYKGLINVSGFHVDPGWKGRLTFSVYNAGPSDVVLEKGNRFALIWYADLDKTGQDEPNFINNYVKKAPPVLSITSDKVSDMTGDIFSPFKLKKEIEDIKEKYNKEILDLRKEVNTIEGKMLIRIGLVVFSFISLIMVITKVIENN